MAEWYVKDLSKLTGVSVQTLHHYDRIDLLKPSIRLSNGYRIYSEKDLLRLQQVIALKFFGFELSQIKALLAGLLNIFQLRRNY
ncbi:MAG: transcriptional regulator, MerR family, mercury resistance [Gammaproteobacteria bacterium]|jgi:DNA-binding transcriptional MerR regulator|nr:transcriptional regulator, MerR family, mercury resistance [Gammaproteobacteria bacterium]